MVTIDGDGPAYENKEKKTQNDTIMWNLTDAQFSNPAC
jgi:hypothetical protein